MKIKSNSQIFQEPYHVILFSILPLLILISSNISEINLSSTIRFGIGSLCLGILLFATLLFWIKSKMKVAVIVTFSLLIFFSYGHVYDFLRNAFPGIASSVRHRYLLPPMLVFYITGLVFIFKKLSLTTLIQLQSALNWIGLILVVYNLASITVYQFQKSAIASSISPRRTQQGISAKTMPDVYFIILDSYTREDVFKSFFNYDNSDFLEKLRDLGFYIPPCSQSNYSYTIASVSTTLNMDYLDQFQLYGPS